MEASSHPNLWACVPFHPLFRSDEPRHAIPVVGANIQLPCGALASADNLKTPFTNYTSGYKVDAVIVCEKYVLHRGKGVTGNGWAGTSLAFLCCIIT